MAKEAEAPTEPPKIDPFVPPWHPDRKGMLASEAPEYLKHVYGMNVSVSSIKGWMRNGFMSRRRNQRLYLIGRKLKLRNGEWMILKRDLIAFIEGA